MAQPAAKYSLFLEPLTLTVDFFVEYAIVNHNRRNVFMKLNRHALENRSQWARADIALPPFDLSALAAETAKAPAWFTLARATSSAPSRRRAAKLIGAGRQTGIIVAEG